MRFIITSAYGDKEDRAAAHTGVDLGMPVGTPVRSISTGVVDKVVDNGSQGIGCGVIVRDADGKQYVYGHLDRVQVRVGDHVDAGTEIGLSGNSGHSTGPHLHFGEILRGKFVDPSADVRRVDALAGDQHTATLMDFLTHPQETIQSAVLDGLRALGDIALHLGYGAALIGSGILLILQILGFRHSWLKPQVLIGAYVLIRYLAS